MKTGFQQLICYYAEHVVMISLNTARDVTKHVTSQNSDVTLTKHVTSENSDVTFSRYTCTDSVCSVARAFICSVSEDTRKFSAKFVASAEFNCAIFPREK